MLNAYMLRLSKPLLNQLRRRQLANVKVGLKGGWCWDVGARFEGRPTDPAEVEAPYGGEQPALQLLKLKRKASSAMEAKQYHNWYMCTTSMYSPI